MGIKSDILKRKFEIKNIIEERVEEIAYDLFYELKERSPVDSYELQQSWAITKVKDGFLVGTDSKYVHILEYGLYPNPPKNPTGKTVNGYSTQAPYGFVRISIMDVTNRYNRSLRK